jgi:hypothetical protein
MPLLRQIAEKHESDPRPWYVKEFPRFRSHQKVKILSSLDRSSPSYFEGKTTLLTRISRTWMRRLAKLTPYDLSQKLLVVEEVSALESIDKAILLTAAASNELLDYEGAEVTERGRITNGDYLMIYVYMLPHNWEALSLAEFEKSIVFELVHVARADPEGLDWDIQDQVEQETIRLLKEYGSLARE